ncbi:MAG: hypothetical protein LBG94_09350 [Treponema sp.]|nr:hypothetical protein [Treponema sp.]
MKKVSFLLLICFIIPGLYADDDYGIRNRTFEIGLANVSAGFSNDFLSIGKIFKETAVLDIDDLKKGFNLNLELDVVPLYLSFNRNSNWGFGLSVGLDSTGIISLPGSMVTFGQARNEYADISGAAFIGLDIPIFFSISRLKLKVSPSVFYPLMFIDPDISYTNWSVQGGTIFDLRYNLRVYTPISLEEGGLQDITAFPGYDINFGFEYPLGTALGLTEKIKFLDFKIGADLYNIPIYPAHLNNYMEMSGRIGSEETMDIFNDGFGDIFDNAASETNYGDQNVGVHRPFKMLAWADWRPFGPAVNFIPAVGFSINPFYTKPFSMEYGLKTRLNLGNVFMATAGVGYYDRLWKNSLDLALNFRFMEINLGVDMRSADFLKSWQGSGLGVNFGLKFGW